MAAKILVVDDDASVRDGLDRALRGAGYTTMTATDGPEALAIADGSGPFDLLLADVVMPQMLGNELARQMRERDPNLPVLYVTAYSNRLFEERTTLSEHEAFLDKPFTMKGLLEATALLLAGRVTPSTPPAMSRVQLPRLPVVTGQKLKTILVIEDDASTSSVFMRMLALDGYAVVTANNGVEGLDRVAESLPDAILLDLRMPMSDGLDFLRRLRAMPHTVQPPVAVITGDYFLGPSGTEELQALGAEVYFKPVWFDDLVGIVRKLLAPRH